MEIGFQLKKSKVEVGAIAPDFTLPSQSGQMVSLKDFVGEKPVVLFFYPKDDTPGCTKQACAFRDNYEGFGKLDAEVIGISSDSVESHRSFAAKHDLPYTLLSDESRKVRKLYSVPNTLGLFPGRVTYVIDKEGVVRHVFSSQLGVEKHVEEALLVLSRIYLSTVAAVKLRGMKTSLHKTGESQYEVVVDEQTIGQVWSWHGSWTAQADGKTYHGHKSRKQAVERVERIHESQSH